MSSPSAAATAARQYCVLVVDDEHEIRALLEEYLGRNGFMVLTAPDATSARAHIARADSGDGSRPDLALLDINMPGENGLSLARWLRETRPAMGLLMVTTAGEAIDRIVGLEVGADDYIPKPFELRELLARIRAVLRRTELATQPVPAVPMAAPAPAPAPKTDASQRIRFGDREVDLEQRKLFGTDGEEITLTSAEFDLLALFARNPNRPLNRDQIMEQAHNRGWDVFDRSIDLRIMRLRRKIERNPDKPEVLKTVRNVGYVFVPNAR